jgi:hypothetical protein
MQEPLKSGQHCQLSFLSALRIAESGGLAEGSCRVEIDPAKDKIICVLTSGLSAKPVGVPPDCSTA